MTWTYTIEEVKDDSNFKDGVYEARCVSAQKIEGKYGNYIQINWKILTPQEFEGETILDRFFIEADNNVTRNIAKKGFKELCEQIQLKVGDTITEDDLFSKFIDRFSILTIEKKENEKTGRVFINIINRKIIEYPTTYNIKPKENQQPAPNNGVIDDLNDEVPSFL